VHSILLLLLLHHQLDLLTVLPCLHYLKHRAAHRSLWLTQETLLLHNVEICIALRCQLTAVCCLAAPLSLGGEAVGAVGVAGARHATQVVGWAACCAAAARAEAAEWAGRTGAAAARHHLVAARGAHCERRTQQQEFGYGVSMLI
jgi:hypothetical protein